MFCAINNQVNTLFKIRMVIEAGCRYLQRPAQINQYHWINDPVWIAAQLQFYFRFAIIPFCIPMFMKRLSHKYVKVQQQA